MARRKHRIVATDQMVSADPITKETPLPGAEPLATANPSTNGHLPAPQPETGDDYWARALGKAAAPPITASPAAVRRRSENTPQRPREAEEPREDTAASYWDRARGMAPRRRSPPERSPALLQAAAVSVAPAALHDAQVTTEDTVAAPITGSEPASMPTESLPTAEPATALQGAHARKEDPLVLEVRGAHVRADDPLAGGGWEAHLADDDALAGPVRGAHVKADDPLVATFSPAHASKVADPVEPSETEIDETAAETVPAKTRGRRWGVLPVAGASAALAAHVRR